MLIFVVDDEAALLNAAVRVIRQARPEAEIMTFNRAWAALSSVVDQGRRPDIVFSDIRMPGLSGLEFAIQLRSAWPGARIVFVTGYEEYALEAFRVHAHGYLLKPLQYEQVVEELDLLQEPQLPEPKPDRLRVQCFGFFEVFWKGEPLLFSRRQTKELFAFLIDREGSACTPEQIAAALWEDEDDLKLMKNRIRVLVSDLKAALDRIGMGEVLIRRSGQLAIRKDMVDCDYYRMQEGDITAINAFNGLYMQQYSWAELTAGSIYFSFSD
ncbi:MAG: response regulator [Oscillospiraceae bacterium]|nr:response regulator [Oscillospiraceae bacterium]